jgi:serine/threonine protein kinase
VYRGKWNGYQVAIKKLIPKHKDSTESVDESADNETTKKSGRTSAVSASVATMKSRLKAPFDKSKKEETEQYDKFEREIRMMCSLRHPNIVIFMGACLQKPNMLLVTEFCVNDSLFKFLEGPALKPLTLKIEFALGSAHGLRYLHSQNPPIVHRDFKSMNLLLDANFNVKVCDFGLSDFMSGDEVQAMNSENVRNEKRSRMGLNKHAVGSIPWIAPEIFDYAPHSIDTDLFSLGVVLWEIFSEQHPYLGELESGILLPDKLIEYIALRAYRPSLKYLKKSDKRTPKEMIDLIVRLWDQDPAKRGTWDETIKALDSVKTNGTREDASLLNSHSSRSSTIEPEEGPKKPSNVTKGGSKQSTASVYKSQAIKIGLSAAGTSVDVEANTK